MYYMPLGMMWCLLILLAKYTSICIKCTCIILKANITMELPILHPGVVTGVGTKCPTCWPWHSASAELVNISDRAEDWAWTCWSLSTITPPLALIETTGDTLVRKLSPISVTSPYLQSLFWKKQLFHHPQVIMLSIQREGILLMTTHLFQLSLQKIAVTIEREGMLLYNSFIYYSA